jgi:hypothetical protein
MSLTANAVPQLATAATTATTATAICMSLKALLLLQNIHRRMRPEVLIGLIRTSYVKQILKRLRSAPLLC